MVMSLNRRWRKWWWHFTFFDDLDQLRVFGITSNDEPCLKKLFKILLDLHTTERRAILTMALGAALLENGKCFIFNVLLSGSGHCRNCKQSGH